MAMNEAAMALEYHRLTMDLSVARREVAEVRLQLDAVTRERDAREQQVQRMAAEQAHATMNDAEAARLRALLARTWRAWNGSCQVCACQFCKALDAAMAEAEKEVQP
jgi:hypothetical protein